MISGWSDRRHRGRKAANPLPVLNATQTFPSLPEGSCLSPHPVHCIYRALYTYITPGRNDNRVSRFCHVHEHTPRPARKGEARKGGQIDPGNSVFNFRVELSPRMKAPVALQVAPKEGGRDVVGATAWKRGGTYPRALSSLPFLPSIQRLCASGQALDLVHLLALFRDIAARALSVHIIGRLGEHNISR